MSGPDLQSGPGGGAPPRGPARYEVRRAAEGIRWPRLALCEEVNAGDGSCLCRAYDEADGYYVIARSAGSAGDGTDRVGHAVAYFLARKDAVQKAKSLEGGGSQEAPSDPVAGRPRLEGVSTGPQPVAQGKTQAAPGLHPGSPPEAPSCAEAPSLFPSRVLP